ncbi:MAG: hypothetical protein ACE5G0_05905 [Rhodothermales bacterium]
MDVPQAAYERILEEIGSDKSPVGIDARHAHVIIIHKLLEIEERLTRIERELQIGDKYNV